jgi:hypothetical protein
VRIEITPSELHVNPELVAGRAVQNILVLKKNIRRIRLIVQQISRTHVGNEGGPSDVPLVGGKQENVST